MKKILVFGMSNNPGGIEHYINNLIEYADHNNFTFDFLTVFNEIVKEKECQKKGINVYKVIPFIKNPALHIIQLKRIIKKNNYNALYMNIMDAGSVFTALITKALGLKIIVHSHNSNSDRFILHYILRPLLNKSADLKLACSYKAGKFMFGDDEFQIIPNAFSFKLYRFHIDDRLLIREKLGIDNNTLVFIHVGRMEAQKNPLYIIDILKEVYKTKKNIKMIYIGDGSFKVAILEKIRRIEYKNTIDDKYSVSGFSNVFNFIGSIDKEEISKYLSASDIYLLPSKYEGLSFSLLESEVNGLYCLISNKIDIDNKICDNVEFLDIDKPNSVIDEWLPLVCNYSINKNSFELRSNIDRFNDCIYNLDNNKFKTIINNILGSL